MSSPLVSIIVSCYNGEQYIADTLNSLLNQTYPQLEIIVVNDGSTDNSETVIKSFADKRISYYYQSNKGQCAALNYGFSKSSGKYIKFYDADDILEPEVIKGQVAALQGMGDDCISFIEWRRFYNNTLPETIDLNDPHTIRKDCVPLEYIEWKDHPPMFQCGLWLIPRELFNKTGLWDERLSLINDTEFFSRIFASVRYLKYSDKGYTFYRSSATGTSLSKDISRKGIRSAILSIDLTAKWFLSIANNEKIKKKIVKSYVMVMEWAYPNHKDLTKIVERRLKQYPKEYEIHTKSGKIYNLVMKLFGWKKAKLLSKYYNRKRKTIN
jgi:glycosyltransferase involved in cell wall biosynthesis